MRRRLDLAHGLMPVSALPILEQVMRIYADQGIDEFVLAVGHLKDDIIRYFEASKSIGTQEPLDLREGPRRHDAIGVDRHQDVSGGTRRARVAH